MEAVKALKDLDTLLDKRLVLVNKKGYSPFYDTGVDTRIKASLNDIRRKYPKEDTNSIHINSREKNDLLRRLEIYLKEGNSNFTTSDIEKLACIIIDFKPIVEYNPIWLFFYSKIEKVYALFNKAGLDKDKIAYALLLTYLNNYNKVSSQRYRNNLHKYIRGTVYKLHNDIYFYQYRVGAGLPKVVANGIGFCDRLAMLGLEPSLLGTKYFRDEWVYWMRHVAIIDSEELLAALNCDYYKACSADEKKVVLAKTILDSYMATKRGTIKATMPLEDLYIKYILPLMQGNPFSKRYWNDLDGNYPAGYTPNGAYNILKQLFIDNPKYKQLIIAAKTNSTDNIEERNAKRA